MPNRYSIVGTNFTGIPESFMMALQPGTPVVLEREPTNQHDPNAIAVWIDGKRVGYIPKKQNAVLAKFMDDTLAEPPMASDSIVGGGRRLAAKFVRSPNSGYPQVEV